MPLCGVPWRPTRPPVDLELWPEPHDAPACFTTIGTWENKGKNIEFNGSRYIWSKHVNFLRYLDLPKRRPASCFRMAMLPPDDGVRAAVAAGGWGLVDPRPISADMAALPRFHRPFARRVHGGEGHLCPAEQRLVQRSQRLLSRGRPAGGDDAHRVQQILPGRAPACSSIRAMRRRSPASTRSPPTIPATAARRGNWPGNISRPIALSARYWRMPGCEPAPACGLTGVVSAKTACPDADAPTKGAETSIDSSSDDPPGPQAMDVFTTRLAAKPVPRPVAASGAVALRDPTSRGVVDPAVVWSRGRRRRPRAV